MPRAPDPPASEPQLPDPNEPDLFAELTRRERGEELRDRIVRTAIAFGAAYAVGLIVAVPLLNYIHGQVQRLCGIPYQSPTDPLPIYLKAALYIALGSALPVIVSQFAGFPAPGPSGREKRILVASLPIVALLYACGALVALFLAAPRVLAVFVDVARSRFGVYECWPSQANSMTGWYLDWMVWLGLAFQLPAVMFLLAKLNIVSPTQMRAYRKYAISMILLLSALITPTTDPISLALVAIPLLVAYELGILIADRFAGPSAPAAGPA